MKKIKIVLFFLLLFLFLDIPRGVVASKNQKGDSEATIHLSGWGDSQEEEQETTGNKESNHLENKNNYPQTGEEIDWKTPFLGLFLTFLTMFIYLIIDKKRRKDEK